MEDFINQEILLIREGEEKLEYPKFKDAVFTSLEKSILPASPEYCKLTLTEEAPPPFSVIPFLKQKIAAVTLPPTEEKEGWLGLAGEKIKTHPALSLCEPHCFSVKTAYPVSNGWNREKGRSVPGIGLLTLLNKKQGIGDDEFFSRWYNGHTPLSLKIHPLWNYARSEVLSMFSKEPARPEEDLTYRGIVEEHVKEEGELLSPIRFFGGPLLFPLRMIQVWFDVNGFIDLKNIETYLVREYHL